MFRQRKSATPATDFVTYHIPEADIFSDAAPGSMTPGRISVDEIADGFVIVAQGKHDRADLFQEIRGRRKFNRQAVPAQFDTGWKLCKSGVDKFDPAMRRSQVDMPGAGGGEEFGKAGIEALPA